MIDPGLRSRVEAAVHRTAQHTPQEVNCEAPSTQRSIVCIN